jgi:hypothetical protein
MKEPFNQTKYITNYIKKNYIRKEVKFRSEEWKLVEKVLKSKKISLREYIIFKITEEYKKLGK